MQFSQKGSIYVFLFLSFESENLSSGFILFSSNGFCRVHADFVVSVFKISCGVEIVSTVW